LQQPRREKGEKIAELISLVTAITIHYLKKQQIDLIDVIRLIK
jgi:hypothetical protein